MCSLHSKQTTSCNGPYCVKRSQHSGCSSWGGSGRSSLRTLLLRSRWSIPAVGFKAVFGALAFLFALFQKRSHVLTTPHSPTVPSVCFTSSPGEYYHTGEHQRGWSANIADRYFTKESKKGSLAGGSYCWEVPLGWPCQKTSMLHSPFWRAQESIFIWYKLNSGDFTKPWH